MDTATISTNLLVDDKGKKWAQSVNVALDYTKHPLQWDTQDVQEAYCRVSYAMKLLEGEQKRLKEVLEERGAIEAYDSIDGYGKLTTSTSPSKLEILNKEGLFEVMGHKVFVDLAKFNLSDLQKELGKATMGTLEKDKILDVIPGTTTLRYNQPK